MVEKKVINLEELHRLIEEHDFYLFGAGIQGQRWVYIIEDWDCGENIIGIIDNNKDIQGRRVYGNECDYPIISLSDALDKTNVVLYIVITSLHYQNMFEQIKKVAGSNHIICICVDEVAEEQLKISDYENVVKESEVPIIPKVIHYAWLGGKMPREIEKNIDFWGKMCPEYEIKLWNERNYDVTQNEYMKQAYDNKAWAFVPDYMRLDIIYQEGGIYLDTDIEIIKKPDELLYQKCFGCCDATMVLNLGSGFGAVPRCNIIKELRDYYNKVNFIKEDGSLDKTSCNTHSYKVLRKYDYQVTDHLQKIGEMNIYPMIFAGTNGHTKRYKITEKTFWLHWGNMSWMNNMG